MYRTSISTLLVPVSALALSLTRLAAAQSVPQPAAPAAQPAREAQAAAPAKLPLGMVMQNNGGSLMRAEMASRIPPDSLIFGDTSASAAVPEPGTLAAVSLFAVHEQQPKTIKKHDLVTIVVREESAFSSNGTTDLKKQADLDAKLDAFIQLKLSHMRLKGIIPGGVEGVPEIKTELSRDMKGEATVDRADTFTARIQAEVVDVKPNGTLVLQAIKRIKTDEEEQRMILTGTCRSDDIQADNTVLSTQLFDLELEKTHKGAVTDTTKRGFVPRLLDQVNPF